MAQKVKYISFIEAIKALDNGEHVRPKSWKTKYMLKNKDGQIVCNQGLDVKLNTADLFYILKPTKVVFQWKYSKGPTHPWIIHSTLMTEEEAKKFFDRNYYFYEKFSGAVVVDK